jgi:cell division protein DivIC
VNPSKYINALFLLLFAGLALWAIVAFVEMKRDLRAKQADVESKQRQLAELEAKLANQEKYLDRLRNDPDLVERLIRQKLAYAKTDEFIFRFEEAKP